MIAGTMAAGLTACTSSGTHPRPATSPSTPPVVRDNGPIRWANWPAYIDKRGTHKPTLEEFIRRSGIDVTYTTPINDNQEFLDAIVDPLQSGTDVGYDVITMTSWASARLITAGQVQPFGPVPNSGNVISALATPSWDPEQRFTMPWQSGLTGIAYDARRVDRAIGSIAELFERPDLAGNVGMLLEWNDTLGMALLAQGRDLNDLSADMISEALDYLGSRTRAGQFAGFYGNDFMPALERGELVASLAWSGDVLQKQLQNPYLKFVVPEEGLLIWSDDLLVPAGSEQAGAVAALADYYYRPDVAARVAAWVNYICPVLGAQEQLARLDPGLAHNPLIFPDQTILDIAHLFPNLPTDLFDQVSADFEAIVNA